MFRQAQDKFYKEERFAPALRRSPHGERIKVRGGIIITSPVSPSFDRLRTGSW